MLRFSCCMTDLTKDVLLRVSFGIIMILVVLFVMRSDSFTGELNSVNDFMILEDNTTYDLLRIIQSDSNTSKYALYSENLDYNFDFYEDNVLLLRVDNELMNDEYFIFSLQTNDLENVYLSVVENGVEIDNLTFVNTLTYDSARMVMFGNDNYSDLLLRSNIENTSIVVDIFTNEDISTITIILLILIPIVILCFPYGYILYQMKLPRVKRLLSLLFVNLFVAMIFFGITLAIFIGLFGENEDVMSEYDVVERISVETDEFKLKTTVGLTKSFWFDGSSLDVTYHIILLTQNDDVEYISNFVLDNQRFRGVQSIEESKFFVEDLQDIFPKDEELESEVYQIEVREKNTGVLVYTSNQDAFYTDATQAMRELNLTYNDMGTKVAISVFLIYFILVVPSLIYVVYRKTKNNPRLKFWGDNYSDN